MGRVLSVMCHKGGTAKTTTAHSLAGYFAKVGKKVLIIDTDEQANMTTLFGLKLCDGGIAHVLVDNLNPTTVIHKTSYPNIDLLMSGGREMKKLEAVTTDCPKHFLLMRERCEGLRDLYDIIIVDTPPALSFASTSAAVFADYVLLTSEPDLLSYVGLKATAEFIKDVVAREYTLPAPKILGVLLSQYDSRRINDMNVFDQVSRYVANGRLDGNLFFTVKPDTKVRVAQGRRKTIFNYAPNSRAAEDYSALGNALIEAMT